MPVTGDEHLSVQPVQRTLRPGPSLPGHIIQQDEEHLTWVIDQTLILCTPPEYFCFKVLLEHANHRVPFAQLVGYLPDGGFGEDANQKSERIRMRHLMSGLRSKIWTLGFDIISLRDVGYMLLLETPEEAHDGE